MIDCEFMPGRLDPGKVALEGSQDSGLERDRILMNQGPAVQPWGRLIFWLQPSHPALGED